MVSPMMHSQILIFLSSNLSVYPRILNPWLLPLQASKAGVGKSTTAVHLAAYLQAKAPTLLVDGDPNRSVTEWSRAGNLPFKVIDERQAALHARSFEHIVIDTKPVRKKKT